MGRCVGASTETLTPTKDFSPKRQSLTPMKDFSPKRQSLTPTKDFSPKRQSLTMIMHKLANNNAPASLMELFTRVEDSIDYNLRGAQSKFVLPRPRTESLKKGLHVNQSCWAVGNFLL